MIRFNILARSRRLAIAALLSVSFASVACASTWTSRGTMAPRDPKQWTTVNCVSCAQAGVQVSVRNSFDAKGKTGRHMAALIRNLNPHPVALVLELVPEQPRPMDEALLSQRWQVMLHAAGGTQDSSIVMLRASNVQGVAVHDVERF
jgi:hypothetical protein